jgi:hypothetical protein
VEHHPFAAATVTTSHKLLTGSWTAEVERLETAVERFKVSGATDNPCRISLFEVVRGGPLHVNVTHKYLTRTVPGWAGPGQLRHGFVHNRTFSTARAGRTIRHILDMVSARRVH